MRKGSVVRQKVILRADVRKNRDKVYVFGDNVAREGLGGQAKEMRGEINAVGIPTKWRPSRVPSAYFTNDDWKYLSLQILIRSSFATLKMFLDEGFDVVMPADGIGTGLADLENRAPKIHQEIKFLISELEWEYP